MTTTQEIDQMKFNIELTFEEIETILTCLNNDSRRLQNDADENRSKGYHRKEYVSRNLSARRTMIVSKIENQITTKK